MTIIDLLDGLNLKEHAVVNTIVRCHHDLPNIRVAPAWIHLAEKVPICTSEFTSGAVSQAFKVTIY
jgi:hypothetical protein